MVSVFAARHKLGCRGTPEVDLTTRASLDRHRRLCRSTPLDELSIVEAAVVSPTTSGAIVPHTI